MGTSAAFAASALNRVVADGTPTSPPPNILDQLIAAGFDPSLPESSLMAVIGDLHINLQAGDPKFTDRFDDALVAELNTISPALTDLTIAGDVIVHHSVSIGGPRYPSHYEMSRLEFRTAKIQMQRFRADIALRAVPGNHDTDREEGDAELWREELQLPPFQRSTLGGVPVFFLNSGQAGMLDPNQRTWFEAEASLIPPSQEVLIIAHHPSFYYVYEEIGLKKIVARAFAGHKAPVWLVGGHGHGFAEQLFVAGSTRFIQMEVTTGNPIQWGDTRQPGYLLLALQNGRVAYRAFRSVREPGFQVLKSVAQLKPYALKWIFDSIQFPAAVFEEGFYERAGRLINFIGIDLKSHLIVCRSHTVRVDLSNANGKIVEYLLPANVWNGYAPPTCDFSATSPNGPWISVSFPAQTGQGVYRIPIPIQFRNSPNLYIRTRTQLQGPNDGLSIYGWGLAAEPSLLTGYEKWLSTEYRTILPTPETDPLVKPQGSLLTNIEHFAFNLPLPVKASSIFQPILNPGSSSPVSGTPVYSRSFRTVVNYRFARRTAASDPLVSYVIEHSTDMSKWTSVEEERTIITPLENGWEEVFLNLACTPGTPAYCRVRVTSLRDGTANNLNVAPGDMDSNGIDDMLQYAFNLQLQNGRIPTYDSERLENKAGTPVHQIRSGLCSILRYPRVRQSTNPGIKYRIEETMDLRTWAEVPRKNIAEKIVRSSGDWDEIETVIMDAANAFRYYRVCLESDN